MKANVKFGWQHYLMDLDDAVVLIKTLEKMIPLESEYVSGEGTVWYINDDQKTEVSLVPMNDDAVAVLKMRGKKSDQIPF